MLKRVLTSLQYTCDAAEDGEIAVEKVRRSLLVAQIQGLGLERSQHGLNSSSVRQINSVRQSLLSPRSTPRQNYPAASGPAARITAGSLSLTSSLTTPAATGTGNGVGNNSTTVLTAPTTTLSLPSPIVKQPYDLILCDNIMPNMCGPEAVTLMRKMGYRGPIFGVTGNMIQEDVEDFKAKGADVVIGDQPHPIPPLFLKLTLNYSL